MTDRPTRKPDWIRVRIPAGGHTSEVTGILRSRSLNTVCEEASCPNRMACHHAGTAAFMLLGRVCTRNCAFCGVRHGVPEPVDDTEPDRLAEAVAALGLRHAVFTSVTRDDLEDGGAAHFAATVRAVKARSPGTVVEVLIPDFGGNTDALRTVTRAAPDVLNHNVETVPRLYGTVRPGAVYERSLRLLAAAHRMLPDGAVKSGIMVGLGETTEEMRAVMKDLRSAGCGILTVGQYLAPSRTHHPVVEYVRPEQFDRYREDALALGFRSVASGPLVRSSFQAEASYRQWDTAADESSGGDHVSDPDTE